MEKRKRGGQSKYTDDLAQEICARMEKGETLRQICTDERMPSSSTVTDWCDTVPGFAARYARARSKQLDWIAEDTMRISDDQSIDANSRRVMVDTRKWLLSKLRPDKYGDLTRIDAKVDSTLNIIVRRADQID